MKLLMKKMYKGSFLVFIRNSGLGLVLRFLKIFAFFEGCKEFLRFSSFWQSLVSNIRVIFKENLLFLCFLIQKV